MTLESYTFGWAFTFLLCFKLFHGAWGDCPSPPNIPNTSSVAETPGTTGQEIVYTCDRNTSYYEIPGKSTTITCQADGTWTDIEVFCIRGCGAPPRLSDASPTDDALNQNVFPPNATVTYNCRPGYIRIPGSKKTITCLEGYTWSTPSPFCQRRSCGNPGEIENGEMEIEDFLFGSRATYTCNTGYRMISRRNYRECQADGTWSNAPPQCEGACGDPLRLLDALPADDGLNQNSFLPGATVTYNCRPGYVQIPGSKKTITCLEGYTWSTPDPFCQRRSCGNPGEIENGNMKAEDFLFGSRATYTCNTGYRIISKQDYRECQADGTWSNAPPQCEASKCNKIWDLQEEARKCTSTPDEWIKYLQVQYLYLQIENLKLDIEIKKKKLSDESTT